MAFFLLTWQEWSRLNGTFRSNLTRAGIWDEHKSLSIANKYRQVWAQRKHELEFQHESDTNMNKWSVLNVTWTTATFKVNTETNLSTNLTLRWSGHTFHSNTNSYPGTAMFKLQLEHEYESNVNSYPKPSINHQVNVLNQDSSVCLFFFFS